MKRRLDAELVRRGLVATRSEAASLVESRSVLVSGALADKSSRLVGDDEPVEIVGPRPRFVSRGGEKLERALENFSIDVTNRSVLDAGSSTGGFTDCVLQRGAARVAAFDVGRHQLHERLIADSRVVQRDGVNVRGLVPADLPFPCSLVVGDLSFISLTKVVAALVNCVSAETGFPRAELVLLVKPQFEVGRQEVSRGKGVITDAVLHAEAVASVSAALEEAGCIVIGVVESPIRGSEGNTEFLVYAQKQQVSK